jgi:hypothetical protein
MLQIKPSRDYYGRWPIAEKEGLFTSPKITPPTATPLVITNRDALKELSLAFFIGWLFTGVLNRSKELLRVSLLPVGDKGESSVLVLYRPNTHLASPSRGHGELFDAKYFTCPLDRSGGSPIPDVARHLCPVVNKIRYNLGHARPDGDVTGLREPDRTEYCCNSKKQKLWAYLNDTLCRDPDLYGPMVGGRAYPIKLPFSFLEKYLTGVDPRNPDIGKLLEETLLWFAMAASGVVMGFPHVSPMFPIPFNEIDLLLYHCGSDFTGLDAPPAGMSWEDYLKGHAVCLMEFTIGHHAETTKSKKGTDPSGEEAARQDAVLAKDVPKNKLMNYQAFCSYRFREVHAHYLSITGDAGLAAATKRALTTTDGFKCVCLSDLVGQNIDAAVLNHQDTPVPFASVRSWHDCLIGQVEAAASAFKEKL